MRLHLLAGAMRCLTVLHQAMPTANATVYLNKKAWVDVVDGSRRAI
jgi:hypothetical protein